MPDAETWLKMFRKAAQRNGTLPDKEIAERLGLTDEDIESLGKVDNEDPEQGFAVNLECRLADVATMEPSAACEAVAGTDDFGRPVRSVPLERTCREVSALDVTPCYFDMPQHDGQMPLGLFVWHFARFLRSVYKEAGRGEVYPGVADFDELYLKRMAWLAGGTSWFSSLSVGEPKK